jgi:hypothetical protein
MGKLIQLSLVGLLLACSAETPNEEIVKEITDTTSVEYTEEFIVDYEEEVGDNIFYDGVIISKTAAFANPNPLEDPIYHIEAASFVTPTKGERMPAVQDNDECRLYGYHWYLVRESTDNPAWISGENLFLRTKATRKITSDLNKEYYQVNDKKYRFDMAATSFEDPMELGDPVYCYDYGFPFMYQDESTTVSPIIISNEIGELSFEFSSTEDGYLLLLLNSDYCGTDINSFTEIDEGAFQIKLNIGYQDGGQEAILHVKEQGGQFILTQIEMLGRY